MVQTETATLKVSDGTSMQAFIARPAGNGTHPGVIVFQEAFGVNAHIRDVLARFAREGYVAIAPELFHRSAAGFEGSYSDFESTRAHTSKMTDDGLAADVRATYGFLRAFPHTDPQKIGSVGFCMGGRASYFANAHLPLQCSVSFYGGRLVPGYLPLAQRMHAPILLFWGGLDSSIPPDQRQAVADALREAGKIFEAVEFSYAGHGFFCDARASFHQGAAEQAWSLTTAFMRVAFQGLLGA